MADRKLQSWVDAGLIDSATAARIEAFETKNARPWVLWAVIGLGALAIGLGLISIIAANWDDIPGGLRLTLHFAMLIGLAGAICLRAGTTSAGADYFHDAMLFIFAVLTLTFFGHLGQVYQTTSPLWQPLLGWMVIITPLLLLFGRIWPSAALWMAGLMGTTWAHASEYGFGDFFGSGGTGPANPTLYWGLIATPPIFAAMLAVWMRPRSLRREYWRLIEQLCDTVILGGITIAIALRAADVGNAGQQLGSAIIHSGAVMALAGVVYAYRKSLSGRMTAAILVAAAICHVFATMVAGSTMGPAIAFMAMWTAIAYAAMTAGWRAIFQIAVAMLALRLIILSFELAYDLLYNGIGLVLVGIITLAVAWIAVRVSRNYAPDSKDMGVTL